MPETLYDPAFDADDDNPDNDELYLEYYFEGAPSIAALAEELRRLAADLEARAAGGWYMAGPVEGGWAYLAKRGHHA